MTIEVDNGAPAERRTVWDATDAAHRGVRRRSTRRDRPRACPPDLDIAGFPLNRLFGMVAHELSTPLTTVAIAAGTLRGTAGPDDGLIDVIVSQAHRMQSVVADLLDMSRLDHGAAVARVERHHPEQLVSQAITTVADDLPEGWVSVHAEGRIPCVLADSGFARRILANLLRNAARHGAPPIAVSLDQDGSRLRIAVRDSGVGMPAAAVSGLFQPYRSHGANGGLGLGLALSRELARAMGGDLVLQSALPACFVLTMPIDEGRL